MPLRRFAARTAVLATIATIVAAPGTAFALSNTPDVTWMTNGRVLAMAKSGNTLYIGGKFTVVQNQNQRPQYTVTNLAAIDMTTGQGIATWTPSATFSTTAAPEVDSLAVSPDGSTVYIGGKFDTVNGVAHKRFAAVSATTGQLDPRFNERFADEVSVITPTASKIYVGGVFQQVNGLARARLAALNYDGTLDSAWVPSAGGGVVRALAPATDGNTIFVGGSFTTMDGQSRQSVARVSASTGALDAWAIPPGTIENPMMAWDFEVTSTTLYGGFGKKPNYAAAFHLDLGPLGSRIWRTNVVGNVQAVELSGNTLYIGGHFGTGPLEQTVCGTSLSGLASLAATSGQFICGWFPQMEPSTNNFVAAWRLLLNGSQLWVGGYFTSIGGRAQKHVARFTL
jgi:hypothetical protein